MTAESRLEPASPEVRRRHDEKLSPGQWIRRHLFRTWYDTLTTIVLGSLGVYAAVTVLRFVFTADYTILRVNLALFMVGRFPRDQLWRPATALVLVAVLLGFLVGVAAASARDRAAEAGLPFARSRPLEVLRRFWPVLLLVGLSLLLTTTWSPTLTVLATIAGGFAANWLGYRAPHVVRRFAWVVAIVLVAAVYLVLTGGGVTWNEWGGIHLNLFLTIAGIALAFPLGLLLALGRRSSLPAIRVMSVSYIEVIRGVPLITLLLMGIFAIGFFLPSGFRPGPMVRVLIALTMFESAYMAEVVRGGLQAVHKGQTEAAQALGLPPWKTMRLIVLPQALRATIPAMVGQFISLYKDTTLVSLVGLLDILTVSGVANAQSEFLAQGLEVVTLGYVGLVFWVGSYAMSREARRLEKRLGVGER